MKEITLNKDLVSYCGLYCGACKRYLMEKCPGCHENAKAAWCKVRTCCRENNYLTCADCRKFTNLKECKKLNNFLSRFFGLIFNSDRFANLKLIKEIGIEGYAKEMTEKKQPTIKRK